MFIYFYQLTLPPLNPSLQSVAFYLTIPYMSEAWRGF